MSKNLQGNSRLLVISDTRMYEFDNRIFAFGPVVRELEEMLVLFDVIIWIGFRDNSQLKNTSFIEVNSPNIKIVFLDAVGGNSLKAKVNILFAYPRMWSTIKKLIRSVDIIHSRAPSNPALIAMLLSYKFSNKKFWFKYAGNWVGKASIFYKVQKFLLKKLKNNSIITINGNWSTSKENIISFENPCLSEEDRMIGKQLLDNIKPISSYNYCFVGNLNNNKGIENLVKEFSKLSHSNLGVLHVIGDGYLKKRLEAYVKDTQKNIMFHGTLNKQQVVEIYKICQFIVLPSLSEGFPKVIGEAMNFSCIPIVSDISCIGQYVEHKKNGFLLNPIKKESLIETLVDSLNLSVKEIDYYNNFNFNLSIKFTYSYFLKRIQKEIIS